MTVALVPAADSLPVSRPTLEAAMAAAIAAIEAASAENSKRAFASDMRHLQGWLALEGVTWSDGEALPVSVLAGYLGALLTGKAAFLTIKRRVASIAKFHREAGLSSPTTSNEIRKLLAGASRTAKAPVKKAAATPAMIRAAICDSSFSLRDKALLAVGFVTGMRRSELVGIRWEDVVEDTRGGLVVTIRRSKTDQSGDGQVVAIPATGDAKTCPATLVRRWKTMSRGCELVFPISDRTVDNVVKRAATLSGYDPRDFGAHSLRAGMVTTAGNAGVSLGEIMGASRHKSAQVATGYMRASEQSKNPAHHAAAKALV